MLSRAPPLAPSLQLSCRARLSPSQIEQKFVEYANNHSLVNLLGPFSDPKEKDSKFDFKDLTDLKERIEKVFKKPERARKFDLVKKFQQSLNKTTAGKLLQLLLLKSEVEKLFATRGIFRGNHLETFIEQCLREAPDVKNLKPLFPDEPLKFRHFRDLATANRDSFRPPLFIAVTNLTTQQLELINSVDDVYLNLSIAKVVRASAGVPGFFRPCEMSNKTERDCYVDGGVVSNFPAWIFAKLFRKEIRESKYFRWFSSKAWVHIGLRVGGDPRALPDLRGPKKFSKTLLGMFTGGARNELESLLSDMVPRSIIIRQHYSQTDAPGNFLDVGNLNAERIKAMVSSGRKFAEACFKRQPGSILRFSNREDVEKQMEKLVKRCRKF